MGLSRADIDAARQALARGVPWPTIQERLGAIGHVTPTRYQFEKFVGQAGGRVFEPSAEGLNPDDTGDLGCPQCHRPLPEGRMYCSGNCKWLIWRKKNRAKSLAQRRASERRRIAKKTQAKMWLE